MKKSQRIISLICLIFLSFNLYAASETQKKLFAIMTGKAASEYHYLQSFYFYSQLKPRLEDSIGISLSDDLALAVAACITSTTHPDNPDTALLGVAFDKIDSKSAIAFCELAYSLGGDQIGMVLTSLSRAYYKSERYDQSFQLAQKAVALGYPFGDVMMAIHYNYGDSVKKSIENSFIWYKKAATKGVTSAMRATSENYLNAMGTQKDFKQALYWAKKAIKNNDGKAFYQLAMALEAISTTNANRIQLLKLAIEVLNLASINGTYVGNDLRRISRIIDPNTLYNNAVLSQVIKSNQQSDSLWYFGDPVSSQDSNQWAYARVSHANSIFTLWSKYSSLNNHTEWYADFLYAGSSQVKSFEYISVVNDQRKIRLKISDPRLEKLAGVYRMTAKLNLKELLYFLSAEEVSIGYSIKSPNRTVSYNLALNSETSQAAGLQDRSAKQVIAKLILKANNKDKDCCHVTGLPPLTKPYMAFHYLCNTKREDLDTRYRMNYNCDWLALYGSDKDQQYALKGTYMENYIPQLFNRIEQLIEL